MTRVEYVPLWCKSNGSFLEGASHPEELIEHTADLGLRAVALTDRDGVYGIVRAHAKANELHAEGRGVHLLIGAQVTVDAPQDQARGPHRTNLREGKDSSTLVLIAQDQSGYTNLCRLLTLGRRREPKGESIVTWDEVYQHAGGLLALWGGETSLLVREPDQHLVAEFLR